MSLFADLLPEFLRHMGRYGIKERKKRLILSPRHSVFPVKFIDQRHHGSDACIKFQIFIIIAHFFDCLVHFCFQIGAVSLFLRHDILQFPDALQKSPAALYAVFAPSCTQIKSTDKHFVGTQCIRAVISHNIIRIYNIAQRF